MSTLASALGRSGLALALCLLPWVVTSACQGGTGEAGDPDARVSRDATLGADADGVGDGTVSGDLDAGIDTPSRWLTLDGVVNARDLGGYGGTGSATVGWRRLLRGGTLSDLTTQGCADFADLGVTTVIDLRESGEQTLAPQPACVTSISNVVSVPMPRISSPSEANYLALLDQAEASVVLLFASLGQAGAGPAYVHCVIGRDRASIASALLLLALGADRAAVLADFLLSNEAGVAVEAAHLEAVLDAIDTEGGIDAYLSGLGVTQAQLDQLSAWALE